MTVNPNRAHAESTHIEKGVANLGQRKCPLGKVRASTETFRHCVHSWRRIHWQRIDLPSPQRLAVERCILNALGLIAHPLRRVQPPHVLNEDVELCPSRRSNRKLILVIMAVQRANLHAVDEHHREISDVLKY